MAAPLQLCHSDSPNADTPRRREDKELSLSSRLGNGSARRASCHGIRGVKNVLNEVQSLGTISSPNSHHLKAYCLVKSSFKSWHKAGCHRSPLFGSGNYFPREQNYKWPLSPRTRTERSSPLFSWTCMWFAIKPHVPNCGPLWFPNKHIFLEKHLAVYLFKVNTRQPRTLDLGSPVLSFHLCLGSVIKTLGGVAFASSFPL